MRLRAGPLVGELDPETLLARAHAELEASRAVEAENDKERQAAGLPPRPEEAPWDELAAWLYSVRCATAAG